MQVNEELIAGYLRENPTFFERNSHLLAEIYLPSPHGHGTISLAERQQLAQRDKVRVLEARLSELTLFGEENAAISEKVHRLSLGLLAARSCDAVIATVTHNLSEDFQVPHVVLRLWARPIDDADNAGTEFVDVEDKLRNWTETLATPYCGHRAGFDVDQWFGETGAPLRSFALVALRGEHSLGLLAMASEDEKRFYPEMGTLYLKRIGELVSGALLRYIV